MGRVRRNWTPEEDALLRRVVNNALTHSRPLLWRELAKSVPGRSNKDCRRRWWNSLADGTAKGPWAEEEDERLIEAVRRLGTNWSQVARAVGSRNSDQCSSHWSQVLDPDINFCDWTTEEDENLLRAVLSNGTNWTTIAASHCPKRTTLALKNRYYTLRLRHGNVQKSKGRTNGGIVKSLNQGSQNVTLTTETETSANRKAQRPRGARTNHLRRKCGDAEEDDIDHEDEGPNAENREDENRDRKTAQFQPLGQPIKTNVGRTDSNLTDSHVTTSSLWSGVTESSGLLSPESFQQSPMSTETWTNDLTDHTSYESPFTLNDTSLFLEPGEDMLGTIQDSAGMAAKAPQTLYGGDPMEMFLPPSPSYPTLCKPALSSLNTGSLAGVELGSSQALADMTTNPTLQEDPSALYEVSINMLCTGAQLKAVMGGLAGAGTCVNIKIDPKS